MAKYTVLSRLHTAQRGQALLIIVLVMVIGLTVGLSVISRSIVNLRTAKEEDNSQRAFSAAEAGVEKALKSGQEITSAQQLENNASIKTVSIEPIAGTELLLNGGEIIPQNDGFDFWLSDYSSDPTLIYQNQWNGDLTVFWGRSDDVCDPDPSVNTMSAIEIVVITGSKNAPVSKRYALDPCANRAAYNKFSSPIAGTETVAGKQFAYKTTITISSGLFARINPLYSSTSMGIKGSAALPSQGNIIESVGSAGDAQRKITFFQGYPEIPSELFPYVLFSPK